MFLEILELKRELSENRKISRGLVGLKVFLDILNPSGQNTLKNVLPGGGKMVSRKLFITRWKEPVCQITGQSALQYRGANDSNSVRYIVLFDLCPFYHILENGHPKDC